LQNFRSTFFYSLNVSAQVRSAVSFSTQGLDDFYFLLESLED